MKNVDYKIPKYVWFLCGGAMAFIIFLLYGMWIVYDPSYCKDSNSIAQTNCVGITWMVRLLIISMPIIVTYGGIRMFKEDPKDSQKPEEKKPEESFDYTKLGANDKK